MINYISILKMVLMTVGGVSMFTLMWITMMSYMMDD